MNKINPRKLISLNVSVALIAFLIWMVTSGVDVNTVYGVTKPIPFTYDRGVFNITDLSVKEGDYSTDIIGFIQNVDPFMNTIKGVSLKIEMYDRNNHLIDVAESGYSSLPSEFLPQQKSAFKIPIDKNNELDHLNIQILAQDWGTSTMPPTPPPTPPSPGGLGSESRTFLDCYNDAAKSLYSYSLILPGKLKLNVTDPGIDQSIRDICNFYYYKTGLYINSTDFRYRNVVDQYSQEFYQEYKSTFPESFKQYLEYVNNPSNHPYIGIIGLSLTPDLSKQIGLNQTKGFLLTQITKGSPADKTGLRAGTNTTTINGRDVNVGGDIILKIDNKSVSKIDDIMGYVQNQKLVGDKVNLTILRDNATRELDLILGQMPSQPSQPSQPTSQNGGNKTQEELYNECVNVAGKSLCDFLFKR